MHKIISPSFKMLSTRMKKQSKQNPEMQLPGTMQSCQSSGENGKGLELVVDVEVHKWSS